MAIVGLGILSVLSSFYEKSWSYNWNGIRDEIRDTIEVAKYNSVSSGLVGIAPRRDQQFYRQYWIFENATEFELLKLTDYPNGTIKTIAYEGLIRSQKFEDKTDLILNAIAENEYYTDLHTGCAGVTMSIGEYLIEFVLFINDKNPPPPPELQIEFGLSESDKEEILIEYRKLPKSWWR